MCRQDGAGRLHDGPCRIYESDVEHPGTGVFNWHDGLHFFMHGCRDDPMPYIGLQSEWFVPIEVDVLSMEIAKHKQGLRDFLRKILEAIEVRATHTRACASRGKS